MKGKIFVKILQSNAVKKTVKFMVKNAPKILTGVSIASSIAATGFAIKGTILAVEIEKKRKARIASGELPEPEHPKLETIKSVWKCYIPTFTFLTMSCGTALYGTSISTARTAMATAACKATELAFDEYRAKVEEEFGADKERKIRQDIQRDRAEQYMTEPTTLVMSRYDQILYQEMLTGQQFYSDDNEIKAAFNKINYQLSHGYSDFVSVAEYLTELGLDGGDDSRGWNVSKTGMLEPRFELSRTSKGLPCIRLYTVDPPYENYSMYG